MFNPDSTGIPNGNYFALPFTTENASLILLSFPWDATVSYRSGTADAPRAIINASAQVDLYDLQYGKIWQRGIATLPIDNDVQERSRTARKAAQRVISMLEQGIDLDNPQVTALTKEVNAASQWVNGRVYDTASAALNLGKTSGLVGGDHSVPYGLLQALSERHTDFGILHIDAHADLRKCYEGFEFSHASIMYNVLHNIPQVKKITQVGIRDLCYDEYELSQNDPRICQFDIYSIAERMFSGVAWAQVCGDIIAELPQKVYISFDIDGLSPDNCPSTGTPVPGGLTFLQAAYLLRQVKAAGRQIVGFDISEICPHLRNEWDAIVGARMLYKLCGCILC